MGNPDLIITIKGWLSDFSVFIEGQNYATKTDAVNIAMDKFFANIKEVEKMADKPEELPAVDFTDIEIRELTPLTK